MLSSNGDRGNEELGIINNTHTLLHIKQINNRDLLSSSGPLASVLGAPTSHHSWKDGPQSAQEPAQGQQGRALTRDKAGPVPPANRAAGGLVGPCSQAPGGWVGEGPLGEVVLKVE